MQVDPVLPIDQARIPGILRIEKTPRPSERPQTFSSLTTMQVFHTFNVIDSFNSSMSVYQIVAAINCHAISSLSRALAPLRLLSLVSVIYPVFDHLSRNL